MTSALLWKLLERFGVQGIQFVLQVILARILDVEHYGTLSIMIIFITLANVFVQNGFNTALIQNKKIIEDDYSSVFWVSLFISIIIYIFIYLLAPSISSFYNMPEIVFPFRILALMLIPGALNSVQVAKVSREMNFRKLFYSNLIGILVSGVVGIIIALNGGGIWSLVIQTLLNVLVASLIMLIVEKWRPRIIIDFQRINILFSFGWKLLVSSLIDTLYQDLQSLIVGKEFSKQTLAFYTRGKQFPQFLISSINGAVQSVMLPVIAKEQENIEKVKKMTRNAITISSYIIFPMMAGLAGIAPALVKVLLKSKWLFCVPFLQIYCYIYAFWPIHTCNLQAINAIGRSDVFLKLEIIKKAYSIILLIVSIFLFRTPIAIAVTAAITTTISCFVNALPNKKLINYSYIEQMKDILPSFMMSIIMMFIVVLVGQINIAVICKLVLQIVAGVLSYLMMSIVTKEKSFYQCIELIKQQKDRYFYK